MTAKCALAMAFLEGRVLNVSNCFKEIGLSNIGREVPRMIEDPFGLVISRVPRTGKSRFGQAVSYTDYRLNKDAPYNQEGITKLREYILENGGRLSSPKQNILQSQLF